MFTPWEEIPKQPGWRSEQGLLLVGVYAISGTLAALGGVMSASRLYSANGQLGTGYELDAIAAVILGGTSFAGGVGTVLGTLYGALIIAVLEQRPDAARAFLFLAAGGERRGHRGRGSPRSFPGRAS